MPDVSYRLYIDHAPAPADLVAAIQQIEVEDHADVADMMRLRVAMSVKEGCDQWTFIDDSIFHRLAKLELVITVGGLSETLLTAHVIETSGSFSNQPGQSTLNVVAMDPTVMMNLEQKTRQWPNVSDSVIATTIFGEHKFIPQVESTEPFRTEDETTMIQRGTDIQFLRQLADRNGYECYVEVDPLSGIPMGHFHSPRPDQHPQGVLRIRMGEVTNVNSLSTRDDMLRPTQVRAVGLDVESRSDQPADAADSADARLGEEPSLNGDHPRRVLLSQTGLAQTGELQRLAQARANRSAWSITADGELNAVAYGGVLRAKRPVLLCGAGKQFSGTYYVERVLHTFASDGYTQRFTLKRNALGRTPTDQFVGAGAAR